MREQYGSDGLHEDGVLADPIDQFAAWFDEWVATDPFDANLAIIATVEPDGWPAARAVLLKGIDARGFVFYTNHQSAKGLAIAAEPRGAMTFVWREVERQVRVVGEVHHVSEAESDAYFSSRPRGAQIGAWTSPQSDVVANREELDTRRLEMEARFPEDVPRPPHWGGYRLDPHTVEFWQGRADRLHDRLRYRREGDAWRIERLAP